MRNIKTKAFGADRLNITLILLAFPSIIRPLVHIINCCIEKSYFPLKWKQANVTPIPKNNKPIEFSHLRSISVLPVLSKILEKIMETQISNFLQINNILPERQSGFRPGHSCCTALSHVTDDIFKALDTDRACLLILLDFTKAFDMVNHKILRSLLQHIGFSSDALRLVSSFLSDRVQRVILRDNTSPFLNILTGVPQGSILGPLLYSIYTSQFNKSLQFCEYHMYADDTQLYFSFKPSDVINANLNINHDLNSLLQVTRDHLIQINPTKSVAILFCKENLRTDLMSRLSIILGGDNIKIDKEAKSLGLIIDNKLRFKQHVTSKLKIGYSRLKMIYSHRHCLNQDIKKMLCDSLVLSPLNYCDSIYGPCLDSVDVRRIQKLQNSCLRLIFGIRRREHISHKLREAKWLNMYNRRILHALCFFYKILKFRSPPYLLSRIVFRTDIHNINIRRKNLLTIPRHRKEIFKRSFTYCVAAYINRFNIIDFSFSFPVFKKQIKLKFLNQG